jgi:hypothetical protein
MRKILTIIFLFITLSLSATDYYIKNSGSNSNTGLSDAQAWQTIAKVNSVSFSAGDVVLFNKGDTWREILVVSRSGTSSAYMTFGSYGTGNTPRILASEVSAAWTNTSGNIWKTTTTFNNPDLLNEYSSRPGSGTDIGGCGIYFENTDGSKSCGNYKSSTGSFASEYDWTWSGSYIYVYATSNPSVRYTSVEIPQRSHIINLNLKNYIDINGINLFYSGRDCISYDDNGSTMAAQTGLIIENCEIGYVSEKGSGAGYGTEAIYSSMIVRGCNIHDCGRRPLSFHLYGTPTVSNVLIENNYFHDGYHTTGPDISVGNSGGGTYTNFTIRRNKFYDPPGTSTFHPYGSNLMFMQRENSNASIGNFYIYSNIFMYPQQAAIELEYTNNPIYIFNNTFYGHNTTQTGDVVHIWVDGSNGGNSSVKVKNNIFYTSLSYDTGGAGGELFVVSGQPTANIDANYNLYYRTSNSLRIIEVEATSAKYYMNTLASCTSTYGWEANSPSPADPKFVTNGTDFHLQASSPAIGKGLYDSNVTVDYDGNARSNPPSIGAYEYGSSSPTYTYIIMSGTSVLKSGTSLLKTTQ